MSKTTCKFLYDYLHMVTNHLHVGIVFKFMHHRNGNVIVSKIDPRSSFTTVQLINDSKLSGWSTSKRADRSRFAFDILLSNPHPGKELIFLTITS